MAKGRDFLVVFCPGLFTFTVYRRMLSLGLILNIYDTPGLVVQKVLVSRELSTRTILITVLKQRVIKGGIIIDRQTKNQNQIKSF